MNAYARNTMPKDAVSDVDLADRFAKLLRTFDDEDSGEVNENRVYSSERRPSLASFPNGLATPPSLSWGPIEHLAHYSCTSSNNITFTLSCLNSFILPPPSALPVDLKLGKEEFWRRNRHNRTVGHPVPLDNLVRACEAFGRGEEVRRAGVVTWRGILVKLMLGVRIELKFYNVGETLYLLEFDQRPDVIYDNQLKEGYHGYAFEALCTQPEDDASSPHIPTLDLWKCIVRRTLGDLDIVFGAEVDCVEGSYNHTSDNLVELKTEILPSPYGRQHRTNSEKKKKWYLQSYLIGIPEIVVGYRDREFILWRVARVPLEQVYSPPSGSLEDDCGMAYRVLKELRAFCRSEGGSESESESSSESEEKSESEEEGESEEGSESEEGAESSKVWRVTVQRGMLLGRPQVV